VKLEGELNLKDIRRAVRYWLEDLRDFDLDDENLTVWVRDGPDSNWSKFGDVKIQFKTEEPKPCPDSEVDRSTDLK